MAMCLLQHAQTFFPFGIKSHVNMAICNPVQCGVVRAHAMNTLAVMGEQQWEE